MPDLENLADIFSNSLKNLITNPSRCNRVRSPLSRCSRCIEVCPTKDISFNQDTLQIGRCLECAICTTACPTGALVFKSMSPMQLIKKVKSLINTYNKAIIKCGITKLEKKQDSCMEVPCLGSIGWETWTTLLLANDKIEIYLPEEACSQCAITTGANLFKKQLKKAENLTDSPVKIVTGLDKYASKKAKGQNLERRQFLASLVSSVAKFPEETFKNALGKKSQEEKEEPFDTWHPAERYRLIFDLAETHPHIAQKITTSLPILKGNCYFCKACSTLCPHNALSIIKNSEERTLELESTNCTGCGLCTEVCFHKALELKQFPADVLQKESEVLAKGSEQVCSTCGETYLSTKNVIYCPSCQNNDN